MELKLRFYNKLQLNYLLLIAPLMELKRKSTDRKTTCQETFNRTAYGIETPINQECLILCY